MITKPGQWWSEVAEATHFVTKEKVECKIGGPIRTYMSPHYHAETATGEKGWVHHENCFEYGKPRIYTFVPFGLPGSAFELKSDKEIADYLRLPLDNEQTKNKQSKTK